MALNGLLREGGRTPRSVAIEFDDKDLLLSDARGWTDKIRLNQFRVIDDRGGALVLGRRWIKSFRLQLAGEAARVMREMLPPSQPLTKRAFRLATTSPKLTIALLAAPFILIDHIPGQWYASMTPQSAANRLERRALEQIRSNACDDRAGQSALDTLVQKLSAHPGKATEAIVLNEASFMVSGRPGGQLFVFQSAIAEIDADVLAALIAHELVHIETGDTLRAAGRGEGSGFLMRVALPWWGKIPATLEYTKHQERVADDAAMAKLYGAGIPLKPAADFFARIDQANQREHYWAQDYSFRHPGVPNRAAVWRTAAGGQRSTSPALSDRQTDDLFNICWERPAGVLTKWSGMPDQSQ